jgi:hypothetical protein
MAMDMAKITSGDNFVSLLNILIVEIETLKQEMSLDTKKKNIYSFEVRDKFAKLFTLSKDFPTYIDSKVISAFNDTFDILMKNIVSYEDILQYINILYNILSEIKINKQKEILERRINY